MGIDLGSTTDAADSTLELSDAELDGITAEYLVIGYYSGAITVSADIDLTDSPTIPYLELISASTVTADAGGISVANLLIYAQGAVSLTDTRTHLTNVSIETTTGNITLVEADGFTVSEVDGQVGIRTDSGSVSLIATTGTLTS